MINEEELICKECNKVFKAKKKSSVRMLMTKHLREVHNMTVEDYLVKHECNGIHPKCQCGCGEDVHLAKTGKSWTWNKYVADSHVGRVHSEEAKKVHEKIVESKKYFFADKNFYETRYDMESIKKSVKDFLTKQYTLSELEEKYKIDRRTLTKVWFECELITVDQYKEVTNYLRFNLSSEKRSNAALPKSDNVFTTLYKMLQGNPGRYNIYSLVREYNKMVLDDKIINHPFTIYEKLIKLYGDGINAFFQKGYHSFEEYTFFKILQFYLGKNHNIDLGFKIEGSKYIYDICIDNKLILEYNSDGQFHSNGKQKKQDSEKLEFAKQKGYIVEVLTKDEIKDINLINKIIQWLS